MAAEENSSEIVKEQSESVAATNLKTLGDAPAWYQNQMYSQSVSAAAGWNTINQSVVSKASEMILNTSSNSEGADVAALGMILKALRGLPSDTGEQG
jgi:hypothetical protein